MANKPNEYKYNKYNRHIGWIIVLALAITGWVFSLGWQAQTIKANEKELLRKADKEVVEQGFRRIDEKLNMIIDRMKQKEK